VISLIGWSRRSLWSNREEALMKGFPAPAHSLSLRTALSLSVVLLTITAVHAQTDPLPSWNNGLAKQAILDFVKTTTTEGSPKFVPPAERVAEFDQDGTLWVEHPVYTQIVYCLDHVRALVSRSRS
jgi:hypothetical protein